MFDSLIKLGTDVVKIATAPIEVAADAARLITKPIADVCDEVKKEIKAAVDD